MARRSLFDLYDQLLDGDLTKLLAEWRAEGMSFEDITLRLRDHDVVVTSETVRRWCNQLGIPKPEKASA